MSENQCPRASLLANRKSLQLLPVLPELPLWVLIAPMALMAIDVSGAKVTGAWLWQSGSVLLVFLIGLALVYVIADNYRSPIITLVKTSDQNTSAIAFVQCLISLGCVYAQVNALLPQDLAKLSSQSDVVNVTARIVALVIAVWFLLSTSALVWIANQSSRLGKFNLEYDEGKACLVRALSEACVNDIVGSLRMLKRLEKTTLMLMRWSMYVSYFLVMLIFLIPVSAASWPILLILKVVVTWQLTLIFPMLLKVEYQLKVYKERAESEGYVFHGGKVFFAGKSEEKPED